MSVAGWALCLVVAMGGICTTEYINRTQESVTYALAISAPFVVVAQVALYFLFNSAASVMGAWMIFTLAMSTGRLINSVVILKEPLDTGWLCLGVALMITASVCVKQAHK